MLNPDVEGPKPYQFTPLQQDEKQSKAFPPSLQTRETRDRLLKWNLDSGLVFQRYKFTEPFKPGADTDRLLLDFFRNKQVKHLFDASEDPVKVQYKRLNATVLSMEFFDRLEDHGIIAGEAGYIRKCLDEDFDGILVGDKLREMLVNPDSEKCDVFNTEDQQEVIFHLFKILVVGGGMCQPEDTIGPYLDTSKALYKDLCAVQKNNKTGKVEIASLAYRVDKVQVDTELAYSLHPRESMHNATIIVLDPQRKIVTLVNHNYKPFCPSSPRLEVPFGDGGGNDAELEISMMDPGEESQERCVSKQLEVAGRGLAQNQNAGTAGTAATAGPVSRNALERRLYRKELAQRVVNHWKYVARERLARIRFRRVFTYATARDCLREWAVYREGRREKWRAGIRAEGHRRFKLLLRGWRCLAADIVADLGAGGPRVDVHGGLALYNYRHEERAVIMAVPRASEAVVWLGHTVEGTPRPPAFLDAHARVSRMRRSLRCWHRRYLIWSSSATQSELLSMSIRSWAHFRHTHHFRRWSTWAFNRRTRALEARRARARVAMRSAVRRWEVHVHAWYRRKGLRDAEDGRRRICLLREGLRGLGVLVEERRDAKAADRRVDAWRSGRALQYTWVCWRARHAYARSGAWWGLRGGHTAFGVRRAVRRWRLWAEEKTRRRVRGECAVRTMEQKGVAKAWRLLYRLFFRLRKRRVMEAMGHAHSVRSHRLCRRVWGGWTRHVVDRRVKLRALERAHMWVVAVAWGRLEAHVVRRRNAAVSRALATTFADQVAMLKALRRWRFWSVVVCPQRRALRRGLKLWRMRARTDGLAQLRRAMRPGERVLRRHHDRLLQLVLNALVSYRNMRAQRESARVAAIWHWRGQAVAQGLRRWIAFVEASMENKAATQDRELALSHCRLGRAVGAWRCWVGSRKAQRDGRRCGQQAHVRWWLDRWRCRVAGRMLRRSELDRVRKNAEGLVMRKAVYIWRAVADTRGVRRAVLSTKVTSARRAVSALWLRKTLDFWSELSKKRAIKRLRNIRCRARYQGKLLSVVWRAWVVVVRAQRKEMMLLRAGARIRARRRAKAGIAAFRRVVEERRYLYGMTAQALWAWKAAKQRWVWRAWRAYVMVRREKKEKARAALAMYRHQLLREGCVRLLESADMLRSQRVNSAARHEARRTERAWAAAARCATHWRHIVRRRRQERAASRHSYGHGHTQPIPHANGYSSRVAWPSVSVPAAAPPSARGGVEGLASTWVGAEGQRSTGSTTDNAWRPQGRGGLWAIGEGRPVVYPPRHAPLPRPFSPPSMPPSASAPAPLSARRGPDTAAGVSTHAGLVGHMGVERGWGWTLGMADESTANHARAAPPQAPPYAGSHIPSAVSTTVSQPLPPDVRPWPHSTTTAIPRPTTRDRPPPRRPVELILEASGINLPDWIVRKLNERESHHPSTPPPSSEAHGAMRVSDAPVRPYAQEAMQGMPSAPHRDEWDGTSQNRGDTVRGVLMGPPLVSSERDGGPSPSSAGSRPDERQGDGHSEQANARGPHEETAEVPVDIGRNRQGREVESVGEEGSEEDEGGAADHDDDDDDDLEALEARLKGWSAEKERFTHAKAELARLEAKGLFDSRRAKELRSIVKSYTAWRDKTMPQIRKISEIVQRLKQEACRSFATSYASSSAPLRST